MYWIILISDGSVDSDSHPFERVTEEASDEAPVSDYSSSPDAQHVCVITAV
jgi:hypothetical protein